MGVLYSCPKSQKLVKSKNQVRVYDVGGLVVIVRRVCTIITESRVIICDLDYKGQWYTVRSEVLRDF